MQLFFDESNQIHSASIDNYLLEKSRIVIQQKNERAYHIFYMLTKSSSKEEKKKLRLDREIDWNYLNLNYNRYDDFARKDNMNLSEMRISMVGLSFTELEQTDIFRIVAAI